MEKTSTMNVRINPTLKAEAEAVLTQLGIPMSCAIDMFLHQIVLQQGIPFAVTLPKPPVDVDMGQMTESQLHEKLKKGYEDYKEGRTQEAKEALERFEQTHFE